MIAAALITFFGSLALVSRDRTLDESDMRTAITISVLTTYLVIVGLTLFYKGGTEKLPPLTDLMLTNFTVVVGVVVPFYFVSSAYAQVKTREIESAGARREQ